MDVGEQRGCDPLRAADPDVWSGRRGLPQPFGLSVTQGPERSQFEACYRMMSLCNTVAIQAILKAVSAVDNAPGPSQPPQPQPQLHPEPEPELEAAR